MVLARSEVQGKNTRFVTDRCYLSRALQLGFGRIQVYAAEKPIVCRDGKRIYVWQPLDAKSALSANGHAIRLCSTDSAPQPAAAVPVSEEAKLPASKIQKDEPPVTKPRQHQESNGNGKRSSIADVLAEAETIKDLVRQAYTRTHQLITNVKRYRKQAQVVRTSLKALKELQQIDA